jgi:hypothetical protein
MRAYLASMLRPFRASNNLLVLTRGDVPTKRALCPWLSSLAPLGLCCELISEMSDAEFQSKEEVRLNSQDL